MDYIPVGRRTRLQTAQKRNFIKEKKRTRGDARREFKRERVYSPLGFLAKKGENSCLYDDGGSEDDDDEIEVIDKSEFEKKAFVLKYDDGNLGTNDDNGYDHEEKVEQKPIVGCEELGKGCMDVGLNDDDDSDDSLQVLGEGWNSLNDDDDGGDGGDDDDDVYVDIDVDDVGHGSPSSTIQVDSLDLDDGNKGSPSRDESKAGALARVENSDEKIAMSIDNSTEFSNSDSSDEDSEEVKIDDHDHDHDHGDDDYDHDDDGQNDGVNDNEDDDHELKEKDEKGNRRNEASCSSEFEKRFFDGLVLPAHPKIDAPEHHSMRRTRSQSKRVPSKKKTREGTLSCPIVIDVDGTSMCSSDGECDDEEKENGDVNVRKHEPKPQDQVENRGKRKRGRPPKNKNIELESPLKRKRVRGLTNSELQRILLNTMCEKGEEGLEDFMSSMSKMHLPLKFSFGVEKPCSPEKSLEEQELDLLWKDLDFGLEACNIGFDSSSWNNKEDVYPSNSVICQEKLCAEGKHHLILDEEIGIRCTFCSFVDVEIKFVTPDFNKNPFRKSESRGWFPYDYDPALSSFEFPDTGSIYQAGHGPCDDTYGTVWDLIPGIKRTLYPHQQEGFEFIWKNIAGGLKIEELKPTKFGSGGCLICHAPGTGKTRLAIVFLQSYMKQYPTSKPVIVAPKNMLLTWEEEFAKWNSDIPFFNLNSHDLPSTTEYHKVLRLLKKGQRLYPETIRRAKLNTWNSGRGVLGVSYKLFERLAGERKDTNEKIRQILLKQPGVLVIDEGHTARNDKSLHWKVLSSVETKRRIILSGTPFQNNFHELHNTISLAREEFVHPLLAGCYSKTRAKKGEGSSSNFANCEEGNEDDRGIKELRDRMKSFVHVYDGGILKKTGLFKSVIYLKPSALQQECFQKVEKLKHGLAFYHLLAINSVHPSLLYMCDNVPEFVDKEFADLLKKHENDLDAGVKTRFLFELIKLSKGEKVLVFNQHLHPLEFLEKLLKFYFRWTEGKELLYMHGGQQSNERQAIIRHFNDPYSEARVLLASTKACGEGIHLYGASRVVFLDVAWNPSVDRQAISRAYRLGQKKDVYVYHLLTEQESEKYNRQAEKDQLSEKVFSSSERQNTETMSMPLSQDRILEEMIQNHKIKSIFERIYYQSKPDL